MEKSINVNTFEYIKVKGYIMEKKLPKIFKKDVSKEHINNEKIYYTSNIKKEIIIDKEDKLLTVEEKIKKLFKSSRYVFNIGVIIKTKKKDYDTKVIGKIKNSLITEDDIEIPIVEIEDIIIKDR